jgi:hypothetical protein
MVCLLPIFVLGTSALFSSFYLYDFHRGMKKWLELEKKVSGESPIRLGRRAPSGP